MPTFAPTLAPILAAPPALQLHIVVAMLSVILAPVILMRRKGGTAHRWLGRIWVLAMTATALSSFRVHEYRLIGPWSPIHLLSVLTLVSLAQGLRAAIRRDIAAHAQIMQSLAFWALGVTGLLTLLPGRLVNAALLGGDSLAGLGVAILGAGALVLLRHAPLRRILGIGFRRGLR